MKLHLEYNPPYVHIRTSIVATGTNSMLGTMLGMTLSLSTCIDVPTKKFGQKHKGIVRNTPATIDSNSVGSNTGNTQVDSPKF